MSPRAQRAVLLAIVATVIAMYASSLKGGFVFDDSATVVAHPGVHGRLSLSDIALRDFWGRRFDEPNAVGTWRPLTTFSFWIDWHLAGGAPWIFRLVNLALYVALLLVADRFLARWAADVLSAPARLLVIALFAFATIHVEVLANATGRAELLWALASLVAIDAVTRARLGPKQIAVAVAATALALLSKESAMAIPLLVPLLAARNASRESRRWAFACALSCAGLLVAVAAFRWGRLPFVKGGPEMAYDNPLLLARPLSRVLGAADVVTRYLEHLSMPVEICPDYSYAALVPATTLREPRVILGCAVLVGATVGVPYAWRRAPRIADALLCLGASYLVFSSLLLPASAVVADRLFLFASLWLLVVLALVVERALGGKARNARAKWLVAGAVCLVFAPQLVLTPASVPHWRDPLTLSAHVVRSCPNNARMRAMRMLATGGAGQPEDAAWSALAAVVLQAQFPRPLDRDAIPGAWEDELPEVRVRELRARLGQERLMAFARTARGLLGYWNLPEAQRVLDGWMRP